MIDLRPHFKHLHWRPMGHSIGVPVASDWADKPADDPVFGLYKNCGLWTMDEANILHECAKRVGGYWLDIGSHTGWTTAHVAQGCDYVDAIDPMYGVDEFERRAEENTAHWRGKVFFNNATSDSFFASISSHDCFDGVVIDGDHCEPHPLRDAQNAMKHLKDRGVILFHDAVGEPVQKGVRWLIAQGFQHRVYYTPHIVSVLWRGEFAPPDYTPTPRVLHAVHGYYKVA